MSEKDAIGKVRYDGCNATVGVGKTCDKPSYMDYDVCRVHISQATLDIGCIHTLTKGVDGAHSPFRRMGWRCEGERVPDSYFCASHIDSGKNMMYCGAH